MTFQFHGLELFGLILVILILLATYIQTTMSLNILTKKMHVQCAKMDFKVELSRLVQKTKTKTKTECCQDCISRQSM